MVKMYFICVVDVSSPKPKMVRYAFDGEDFGFWISRTVKTTCVDGCTNVSRFVKGRKGIQELKLLESLEESSKFQCYGKNSGGLVYMCVTDAEYPKRIIGVLFDRLEKDDNLEEILKEFQNPVQVDKVSKSKKSWMTRFKYAMKL